MNKIGKWCLSVLLAVTMAMPVWAAQPADQAVYTQISAKLDLVFSYALFLLCYVCILFIGPIILKHADFRYLVGEEND